MKLKLMKLKDVHLCLDFMPSKFKKIVKADLGQQAASQKTIKLFKNKRFKNIDSILQNHGIKAIFFLKLSPVLPINMLNYILGGFESK